MVGGIGYKATLERGGPIAPYSVRWKMVSRVCVNQLTTSNRCAPAVSAKYVTRGWRLEGEPLARLNMVSALPDRCPESFASLMAERRASTVNTPLLGD
jgi:hypothetical protein